MTMKIVQLKKVGSAHATKNARAVTSIQNQ